MKLTTVLSGVPEFVRAVELTDKKTKEKMIEAIHHGTEEVAAKAEEKVPRRSGELASTIRAEYSKDQMTGFVRAGYGKLIRKSRAKSEGGLARAKQRRAKRRERLAAANTSKRALAALDLGVYAPVVERGDPKRHKPARPFLIPALMEERPEIMNEIKKATAKASEEGGL